MIIFHKIDDFLLGLFNKEGARINNEELVSELTKYYTYNNHKPKVSIKGEIIKIEIDIPHITSQEKDYYKAIQLCERENFLQARDILNRLIQNDPTISDYYRLYGQALSEEGNQDEAINYLIDALKWNPKNTQALLMMGNIFAKYKNDITTARKYYNQVLEINPEDYIALNNVGGNLLKMHKIEEGIEYLEKAYAINPKYPNTLYGLTVGYKSLDYPRVAFDFAIECIKASEPDSQFYKLALSEASEIAVEVIQHGNNNIFNEYKEYLESKYQKEIRVKEDHTISTPAKIEFSEVHNRNYHLIKYKPDSKAIQHLLMHELVHLEFAEEAREAKSNMLFLSGGQHKALFFHDNQKEIARLKKENLGDESVNKFFDSLLNGINSQIYNTPIDLFIEDYLFNNYKELRSFQFASLLNILSESILAVTNKRIEKFTPRYILTASKILNIVMAIQFKELFGISLIKKFNPAPYELKEAERMWNEFTEYRSSREPGEEYEIIKHWGEDLRLNKFFELVDEVDYQKKANDIDDVLQSAINDPYGLEQDINFKQKETKKFLESQAAIGLNQAVIWFMVDALKELKNKPKEEVKKIAFEIAMVGTQGINPAPGYKYTLNSLPKIEFSGYHLLAYYYTSWKLAIPEMVSQLNLPFEKEYESALTLYNQIN